MNSDAKEEKEIQRLVLLSNRYGASNYLRKIGENTYKYEGEMDYLRVGLGDKDDNSITFIDPSGGPFLTIGSKVFGIEGEISNIESTDEGFTLTFK